MPSIRQELPREERVWARNPASVPVGFLLNTALRDQAKKPCLTYKVLAAGRTVNSPQQVKERMAVALNGVKLTDAIIVGVYQRFNDQIGQTAQFVREILKA